VLVDVYLRGVEPLLVQETPGVLAGGSGRLGVEGRLGHGRILPIAVQRTSLTARFQRTSLTALSAPASLTALFQGTSLTALFQRSRSGRPVTTRPHSRIDLP